MMGAFEQRSFVLRPRAGAGDRVYWDVQWRFRVGPDRAWTLKKRRLGLAWLEPDDGGGWRKRRGRCREGSLDERAALLDAREAMERQVDEAVHAAEHARLAEQRSATFRGLANDWLHWFDRIRGIKPSTLRDYRTLLREPGQPHARGGGRSVGRIVKAFGDELAAEITTADVSAFLRARRRRAVGPQRQQAPSGPALDVRVRLP